MLNSGDSTYPVDQPRLHIKGGYSLAGEVRISGAKNSALVLMAGALLADDTCYLRNVPALADIGRMAEILQAIGVTVKEQSDGIEINAQDLNATNPPYALVSQLRASFFAIGPLLARLGVANVPLPGGCAIGARPVELHVRGLQALGAEVIIDHGVVQAYAPKLKGAKIYLDYPSVGATETLMMAATLADGETVIDNAAQEPEVVDLANFCIAMGAKIYGAGTNSITIVGVDRLHGTEYDIIPDRIEASTFLLAAAITHSEISLAPIIPGHLTAAIAKLEEIGAKIKLEGPQRLRIIPAETYSGSDIETLPYPGFPTDMQSLFMSLLAVSKGNSLVSETVFENRFGHVPELNRMGADIRVKGNHAVIRGVPFLSGAPVMGTDLRATAALVVAGLAAKGETIVHGLQHLDRGYEAIEIKLGQLGAKLERRGGVTQPVKC
ncbi:UDP-N-acetylglucosamine 1-carboxyvinyltransferase [Candidatus Synechococcus calcipolaris G9]|uniref:UDP-N-acetylglucosamine 1-carboxyvinyltransferase n=1 Tax=Candidatus Synechococcus calcipolaris G9 TaxID=1497997 RepID=A0ABT6EUJ4_9SYNE|nr:UDP-N-acetylglucosamine 1-carboxyvinyltransferase [Candidatus Synechococcus calcipolaris]MDG2989513.1 UDP-N-acetylglucosamine 1-carboxyvinyltransferase [Candidatus Synechococcus calcipolaris G9]